MDVQSKIIMCQILVILIVAITLVIVSNDIDT